MGGLVARRSSIMQPRSPTALNAAAGKTGWAGLVGDAPGARRLFFFFFFFFKKAECRLRPGRSLILSRCLPLWAAGVAARVGGAATRLERRTLLLRTRGHGVGKTRRSAYFYFESETLMDGLQEKKENLERRLHKFLLFLHILLFMWARQRWKHLF